MTGNSGLDRHRSAAAVCVIGLLLCLCLPCGRGYGQSASRRNGAAAPVGPAPSAPAFLQALPADPLSIMAADPAGWRRAEFEVYRWKSLPEILIFDTASHAVQSALFKRLAFYVEKSGYTGRPSSFAALADKHGYTGHNYRARDLARFFDAVPASGLLPEERLLREVLLANGVIGYRARRHHPGAGGIISISRSSSPALRRLLLVHELSHGVFTADARYREGVGRLWSELSPAERRFWSLFLYGRDYNVRDITLVVNEFQAHLLQQPLTEVNAYFGRQIRLLARSYPSYAPFLTMFEDRYGGSFAAAAARLERLLAAPLSEGGESFYTVRARIFESR